MTKFHRTLPSNRDPVKGILIPRYKASDRMWGYRDIRISQPDAENCSFGTESQVTSEVKSSKEYLAEQSGAWGAPRAVAESPSIRYRRVNHPAR